MAGRTDLETLVYAMEVRMAKYEKDMAKARGDTKKTADSIQRDLKAMGADVGRQMQLMSTTAQLALGGLLAYSLKLASDADEVRNAFGVAFKGGAADAEAFAKSLSKSLGRDVIEVQEGMTRLQLVITGMGVESAKSAELVKTLTERAVDVGSLFNVSDKDALGAMISGLTGETEPLKRFGVVLNETAVKAELLRMGFKGNAEQASEAAKAIARTNIIMAKTAVAQGDAAKTADGAANSAKAMRAAFNDAARDLGAQLLPAATAAMKEVTKLVGAFNDMPSGVQMASLAVLAFIAAGGPIAGLLANIGKVIKLASAARGALISMVGANVAAGAGGALAVAGAPAAVAVGGGLAFAAGMDRQNKYKAVLANVAKANDEQLAEAIAYARTNLASTERGGAGAATQRSRWQSEMGRLLAAQMDRGFAGGGGGGGSADTAPVGGFTLGDLANGGGGTRGTGGGRGRSGPSAEDLSNRRAELELVKAKEVAEAAGDTRRLEALKGEQFILDRIAQYKALGLSASEAETAAILDRLNVLRAQAEYEQLRASVRAVDVGPDPQLENSGQAASQALVDQSAEMTAIYADIIGGAFDAWRSGGAEGFFQFFAQRLGQNAANALIQAMATAAAAESATNSSGWGQALGWVAKAFGGVFANPGEMEAGQWGIAGEAGPEMFRAKPGGGVEFGGANRVRMLAPAQTVAPGGRGGGAHVTQNIYADQSIMTPDIFRRIHDVGMMAAQFGATSGAAQGSAAAGRASARQQSRRIPR